MTPRNFGYCVLLGWLNRLLPASETITHACIVLSTEHPACSSWHANIGSWLALELSEDAVTVVLTVVCVQLPDDYIVYATGRYQSIVRTEG